jgi:magnesium transporter
VFSDLRTNDSARIYVLKRELAEVRRAVHPLREPIGRFTTGVVRGIDPEAGPYFRDVADHLSRVSEAIESLDSLLSTAFDAHLAQISIQQNDDMRRISATIGLIAAPALIGTIYGMNFRHMPELGWRYGYAWALGLMVVGAGGLWVYFKRKGWL